MRFRKRGEKLPANWDSYGARMIRAEIVGEAADLLRKIVQPDTPQPAVVPEPYPPGPQQ